MNRRRWIEPQDFRDMSKRSDLTRKQAADLLDVTGRTIQNWETGGARMQKTSDPLFFRWFQQTNRYHK